MSETNEQIQNISSGLFPGAKVILEGSSEYDFSTYQYAKTSIEQMKPQAIIYPTGFQDILTVVNYAKKNGLGVAVRTGGHQYSGASSTSGQNVIVDLSNTFESPTTDFVYNKETNLLRVGISFSLLQFYEMLMERNMFLPGGICSQVHLGGHVQTGGYGMIIRSFGLLCDYVEKFEIILADQENARVATVWKPNSELAKKEGVELIKNNDELFWAVMGGSPGNFGILTHVTFRPLHDKDYPDSRMMKFTTPYTTKKHRKLEALMAEMNDDVDLPKNYDLMYTIMGKRVPVTSGPKFFELIEEVGGELNEDQRMQYLNAKEYGDGVSWEEKGEGSMYFGGVGSCLNIMGNLGSEKKPKVDENGKIKLNSSSHFIVYAKWDNVNGEKEKFGEKEAQWFKKIREAAGGKKQIHDYNLNYDKLNVLKFLASSAGIKMPYCKVDYKVPIPCSKQMRLFAYDEVREFNMPYYKRTYISEKADLSKNGYVDMVTERIQEIDQFGIENNYSVNVVLQEIPVGGNHAMYTTGFSTENCCHSWRKESKMCLVMDVFYDPNDNKAQEFAKKWAEENDKIFCKTETTKYSEFDRRWLWSTYGKVSDPEQGTILDTVWDKYFDSSEKYEKLRAIKRQFDPEYVFTANGLGVDASNAPKGKCIQQHEK